MLWKAVSEKRIIKSFQKCRISNQMDDTQDDVVLKGMITIVHNKYEK